MQTLCNISSLIVKSNIFFFEDSQQTILTSKAKHSIHSCTDYVNPAKDNNKVKQNTSKYEDMFKYKL